MAKALGLFEPTPEAVKEKREQLRREKGAFSIDLLDNEYVENSVAASADGF